MNIESWRIKDIEKTKANIEKIKKYLNVKEDSYRIKFFLQQAQDELDFIKTKCIYSESTK